MANGYDARVMARKSGVFSPQDVDLSQRAREEERKEDEGPVLVLSPFVLLRVQSTSGETRRQPKNITLS